MNTNKVVIKGVKIAFVVMLILLIVYGIMRASFTAYDYGYRLAIEGLSNKPVSTESVENTESTEDTESTEGTGE